MAISPVAVEIPALRVAGGGVWSRSLSNDHKREHGIGADSVWVNAYGPLDPNVGFGGFKESGYGWKSAADIVDSYLYQKAAYMVTG